MTYAAFFPTGGMEGFDYLRRTRDLQTRQMAREDQTVALEVAFFKSAIRGADTANELVSNDRLLAFVLTAFGLEDKAGDPTLLRRALNESTDKPRALTTYHDDARVRELAKLLAYGDEGGAKNRDSAVIAEIEKRFLAVAFEKTVAAQDRKLAEALALDRRLAAAAAVDGTETDKWERLTDDPAAVRALNRSLDLPENFSQLTERQRIAALDAAYRDDFRGDAKDLADARDRRDVVRAFLAYDPAAAFAAEPGRTIGFYQPILPFDGLAGWRFLNQSLSQQQEAFNRTAEVRRDVDYFLKNIGRADTAEKLVEDRRLLKVALGAFGMADEIDKRALLQRALEGGVEARDSVANRLVDRRFKQFVGTFGYGDAKGPQVQADGFAEAVVRAYRERAFEIAVGEVNNDMRLAMNFQREIVTVLAGNGSDEAKVFSLLGDKALRDVFEPALGLPQEFGKLDIEQQADVLKDRFRRLLGDEGEKALLTADGRDTLLKQFFLRQSIAAGPSATTRGSAALTLLQAGQSAQAGGTLSILA